ALLLDGQSWVVHSMTSWRGAMVAWLAVSDLERNPQGGGSEDWILLCAGLAKLLKISALASHLDFGLDVQARGPGLGPHAVECSGLVQAGCLLGEELARPAAQCVTQDQRSDVLGQCAEPAQRCGERRYLLGWHARPDEIVPHVPLEDAGEVLCDRVRRGLED